MSDTDVILGQVRRACGRSLQGYRNMATYNSPGVTVTIDDLGTVVVVVAATTPHAQLLIGMCQELAAPGTFVSRRRNGRLVIELRPKNPR